MAAIGCQKKEEKKLPTMGVTEGNTYTNDFINLTVDIPEGWSQASEEERLQETFLSEMSDITAQEDVCIMKLTSEDQMGTVLCKVHPMKKDLYTTEKEYVESICDLIETIYDDHVGEVEEGTFADLKCASLKANKQSLKYQNYSVMVDDYIVEIEASYIENEANTKGVQDIFDSVTFNNEK